MGAPERILELALEAGFDLAGLVPLGPPRDAPRFEEWLAAGFEGEMGWLRRNRERILDPRGLDPGARTLLVVGLGHAREPTGPAGEGGARVARYAAGRDYHNRMTRLLRRLSRRLEREGLAGPGRTVVDAGPLLERSHASEAGLGFPSKAANLLHPVHGPWFFLGELLLDVELEEPPAGAPPAGSCGTCTACLDACPTGAIVAPGRVDARLCISYQTIENRGPIPHELRELLGPWAFGCDVCSEVCPWGTEAPDRSATWGTHPFLEDHRLTDWLELASARPTDALAGSPLQRPGPDALARNAAIVLGNLASDRGREALRRALATHPSGLVRAAAYWALLRSHGSDPGVERDLEAARAAEPEAAAAADMDRSRALG